MQCRWVETRLPIGDNVFNCKLFNTFILVIELQHTVNIFVVTIRALYFPIREHKQACGLAKVLPSVWRLQKRLFPQERVSLGVALGSLQRAQHHTDQTVGIWLPQLHPTPTAAKAACLTCRLMWLGTHGSLDRINKAALMVWKASSSFAICCALLANSVWKPSLRSGNHFLVDCRKGVTDVNVTSSAVVPHCWASKDLDVHSIRAGPPCRFRFPCWWVNDQQLCYHGYADKYMHVWIVNLQYLQVIIGLWSLRGFLLISHIYDWTICRKPLCSQDEN